MGCTSTKGTFGPISRLNLNELEERDSDYEVLEENEFPYMSGRLKQIDWMAIVQKGQPWSDNTFPYGKYSLFMDHNKPQDPVAKAKWTSYHWKRASEFYGKKNFNIFEGVDPSDIIMGNCNNCYALAALTGMAEATFDEQDEKEMGQRIMDNFLTQEINDAGCYAIQFIIDGEPRTIVIDDYFPFTYNKKKKEVFAFCKSKGTENELWVQLIEKAWAKLCGSYETSEMGRCDEFLQNFDGTPTEVHWTEDYQTPEQRDKLFKLMNIADRNSWIMTASCLKRMSPKLMDLPPGSLQQIGIKNCHSYTVIDVREVITDSDQIELMIFLRNPTGNFFLKDNEVWKGDYSQLSSKWTENLRNQLNYHVTEEAIKKAKQKHMRALMKWAKKGGKAKLKKKVKLEEDLETEDNNVDAEEQGDDQGDAQDNQHDHEKQTANEEMTPMEGGSIIDLKDIEYRDLTDNNKLYKREMSRLQSIRKRKHQNKQFEGGQDEAASNQDQQQTNSQIAATPQPGSRSMIGSRFGSAVGNRIPKIETDSQRRDRIKKNKYKTKHDYQHSNALGSTFWMNINDFCKYFYVMHIGFTNKDFIQSFCKDQVFSFKWGCFELDMPTTEKDCYFSLYQQNDRFMEDVKLDPNIDYEYPEMTFIVAKVVKIPPKTGKNTTEKITGECAYIDGITSDLYNSVNLRIDKMTAGKYLCFYTTRFPKEQLCRKLNTIFYAPYEVKLKRVSARLFGKDFLEHLEQINYFRQWDDNYQQPYF